MYHYNYDHDDGMGLDLTPFVTAVNTGADAYAKIAAAEAAKKAAANAARPAPVYNVTQATRRTNPMAYVMLAGVVVGGFFLLRKFMGKRRR
ncbi:MAG: hypothetical protein ACSLEZ_00195 [Thiobacillus sp.]